MTPAELNQSIVERRARREGMLALIDYLTGGLPETTKENAERVKRKIINRIWIAEFTFNSDGQRGLQKEIAQRLNLTEAQVSLAISDFREFVKGT